MRVHLDGTRRASRPAARQRRYKALEERAVSRARHLRFCRRASAQEFVHDKVIVHDHILAGYTAGSSWLKSRSDCATRGLGMFA